MWKMASNSAPSRAREAHPHDLEVPVGDVLVHGEGVQREHGDPLAKCHRPLAELVGGYDMADEAPRLDLLGLEHVPV
jgi:hypothetical protein